MTALVLHRTRTPRLALWVGGPLRGSMWTTLEKRLEREGVRVVERTSDVTARRTVPHGVTLILCPMELTDGATRRSAHDLGARLGVDVVNVSTDWSRCFVALRDRGVLDAPSVALHVPVEEEEPMAPAVVVARPPVALATMLANATAEDIRAALAVLPPDAARMLRGVADDLERKAKRAKLVDAARVAFLALDDDGAMDFVLGLDDVARKRLAAVAR